MSNLKDATQTTVAKINNVEIVVIEYGEKRVAIKPICDALGIDFSGQLQRIKSDEILGSTMEIISTVGADGKEREMQTIPFMYVFGWLFLIDSRKVKPEAKEMVVKYQIECYKALYNHFTSYADFVEQRQYLIEKHLTIVEAINHDFNQTKNRLLEAKGELNRARKLTFANYDANNRQLKMFTTEEQEG